MASGDGGGVVHASAVVRSPAVGVAGEGPDLALPDQVLDAEHVGVVLHPVGDLPAGVELFWVGSLADAVAEGDVARPADGVLGLGAWAR